MAVIDHVIVLVLENRSFDHMLGFLDHPDPAFDGLTNGGPYNNPGWDGGPPVPATPEAKLVLPVDPDHCHDAVMEQLAVRGVPTNQGFVSSFERKGRGLTLPAFGGLLGPLTNWWQRRRRQPDPIENRGPLVMLCQPPAQVPVLARLALDFAVCTRWFCSVPGETWPNRNFMHAGTSDGEADISVRFYTNRTIFEVLEEHGTTDHAKTWHIYHDDTPQIWAFPSLWDTPERHANWFPLDAFASHVAAGRLPAYSFIEPNHRPPLHTFDHAPLIGVPDVSNNQHPGNNQVSNAAYDTVEVSPDNDFSRGEALIASVYEALRSSPEVFERSLLLITYDEHGGFYDHVPPPMDAVHPGGGPSWFTRVLHRLWHRKASAFDFTILGPRVPAVVVSPYVAAGTVDAQVRDHASVPATVRALFAPAARPLSERDNLAAPFHTVATLVHPRTDLPDLSPFISPERPTVAPVVVAGRMPSYYEDFARQADLVRQRLADLGEPEATRPTVTPPTHRPLQITEEFVSAAHRHRRI